MIITCHIFTGEGTDYQNLGANYLYKRSKDATIRRTVKHREPLGYEVTFEYVA